MPEIPAGADKDSFSFFCDIKYDLANQSSSAMFEVIFLFDGKEATNPSGVLLNLGPVNTDSNMLKVELQSDFLRGRLGTGVKFTCTNLHFTSCYTSE